MRFDFYQEYKTIMTLSDMFRFWRLHFDPYSDNPTWLFWVVLSPTYQVYQRELAPWETWEEDDF